MFSAGSWAQAFINTLEKENCETDDGIMALTILAAWIKSLPGTLNGRAAAEKLETLIRKANSVNEPLPKAHEAAIRFVILAVRKNVFHHIDLVIERIKNIMNKKRRFITASLEYAFPPENDDAIISAILRHSGAGKVELKKKHNPDLIGGYKLRIEDRVIDASVRSQLEKLKTCLAGDGGY